MTNPPMPPTVLPVTRPFFDAYTVACLIALGVIFTVELPQGPSLSTPLLLMVGLAGVLLRWRVAPLLLVVLFATGHLLEQERLAGGGIVLRRVRMLQPTDVALCASMLAYVVAHYRLQSLTRHVFPIDPRLREPVPRAGAWSPDHAPTRRRGRIIQQRRSWGLVTPEEVGWLVLALPIPALLAQLLWNALNRQWNVLGLPVVVGRVVLVMWVLAVGGFIVAALLRQWRLRQFSSAEATLFLQDVLWQETRREQRRVNQWLAWAHLRRKEER
ncbi:MAG: hypothetical protein L0Z62_43090 [Gemmataceae bacterium]|nr:hypothetical protein [Gemmataceae bacterium]